MNDFTFCFPHLATIPTADFGEAKTGLMHVLMEKVLLVTHLHISPILYAAGLMTSSRHSALYSVTL